MGKEYECNLKVNELGCICAQPHFFQRGWETASTMSFLKQDIERIKEKNHSILVSPPDFLEQRLSRASCLQIAAHGCFFVFCFG